MRRIEPEGVRILGNDAARDLDRLRMHTALPRGFRCHPDRGGSRQQMAAVNHAFEQLHRILVEEGGTSPWSPGESASAGAYLSTVRVLLFRIALNDFALNDAVLYLEELVSDKGICAELVCDACSLAKRLCAIGALEKAKSSLAVAGGIRIAQSRGLNFDREVRIAEETVAGRRKPCFVLNHTRTGRERV